MSKKTTPPTSPLRQMMGDNEINEFSIDDLLSNDKVEKEQRKNNASTNDLKKVNPKRIMNWCNHDRPENELGDIDALADEFKDPDIGQQQPCIVRPIYYDDDYDYELIVGERRWRAALKAKINLTVIIKPLSDQQAEISQLAENLNREDLSDYALGMSIARLLESKILKQKDLQKYFKKFTPVRINRLLSFSQVPNEIWSSIGDMRQVTARTATEIRALIKKGEEYKHAILELAPKLKAGKIGSTTLLREVEKTIKPTAFKTKEAIEVRSSTGQHLFTWRKDSNKNISISFPKDIRGVINKDKLQDALRNEINNQLNNPKE